MNKSARREDHGDHVHQDEAGQGQQLGRLESMRRIKEQRRQANIARKKLEFQPVEGEINVSRKHEPKLRREGSCWRL